MNAIILGMGLLGLLALGFILWPMLGHRKHSASPLGDSLSAERQQANVSLYQEHLDELKANLARGSIDEDQYQTLLLEQQRALLEDSQSQAGHSTGSVSQGKLGLVLIALVLPVLASIWYWQQGAAQDWQITQDIAEKYRNDISAMQAGRRPDKQPALALVNRLQSRLESRPENQQSWYLLARTAMELQDYLLAIRAYQRLLQLAPNSGGIMAEQAQAMFLGNGNQMSPDVAAMVAKSLTLEPNNTTALGLAGIAAFEQKDYAMAIQSWRQALKFNVAQGESGQSSGAQALMGGIARAQELLGESAGGIEEPAQGEGVSALPSISVNVEISKDIAASSDQVVFVYARAWQGSKMPLAIRKLSVADLPLTVTLDESMAMAPGMTIASVPELEVIARLSKDGGAIAQPGDWIGSSGMLELKGAPASVGIIISEMLP